METILAILVGVGLSAAAGIRVFTPLLITNIAAKSSFITLASGFEWLESTAATIAFAAALLIEMLSYYIPFIDNLTRFMASPIALLAGIILTASFLGDMDPFFSWSISILAGGESATLTQLTTTAVRGTSTAITGGIGNFFISIIEGILSFLLTMMTLILPMVAVFFLIIIIILFYKLWRRGKFNKVSQAII